MQWVHWLKKYGEAVYATRAWEKYGEGPTKMGAEYGVFTAPAEGTAKDIRYTRSKDNTTLYAILLGWDKDQKEITLRSLSSDRIDITNLKSVELINGEAGNYLPLSFKQYPEGLTVSLPEKPREELAYVLKLSFKGKIPSLDKYVDVDCTSHYYIVPGNYMNNPLLGADLKLNKKQKNPGNQWDLEYVDKGIYKIHNRGEAGKVLTYNNSGASDPKLYLSDFTGNDNQLWKIDNSFNALYKISNKQFSDLSLSVNGGIKEGNIAEMVSVPDSSFGWRLMEVCELKQEAFKPNNIPGIIEAENFDIGCPGDAYFDKDEVNAGGKYRQNQPVDIDTCSAGTYLVGWTNPGEWLAYTVSVKKSANYQISFYLATIYDTAKLHLECDGSDKTGIISVPNTAGFQNWTVVMKKIKLDAGEHVMKLYIDNGGFNVDKMVFKLVI